jgi:hypothetical protein
MCACADLTLYVFREFRYARRCRNIGWPPGTAGIAINWTTKELKGTQDLEGNMKLVSRTGTIPPADVVTAICAAGFEAIHVAHGKVVFEATPSTAAALAHDIVSGARGAFQFYPGGVHVIPTEYPAREHAAVAEAIGLLQADDRDDHVNVSTVREGVHLVSSRQISS